MKSKKALYFLRKDLRLQNNKIFNRIRKDGFEPVLVYLWNDSHLDNEYRGEAFKTFLKVILEELKKESEEKGFVFHLIEGTLIKEGKELAQELDPDIIYMQKQYLPWEISEEETFIEAINTKTEIVRGNYLLAEPEEVLTNEESYYKVFTPYYKKWMAYREQKDVLLEKKRKSGYSEAEKRIKDFFKNKLKNYQTDRDYPDLRGTSELSAYINLGVVSVERLIIEAKNMDSKGKKISEPFIRQLAWRDFYYQLYFHQPEILSRAFKKKFDGLDWENDKKKLKAWKEGKTGYPFIDAGMRQLIDEGYMHNRLRMAVASFLTKDLMIDWKTGEKHFMHYLTDGDRIVNNGGWQWAASTGADAQPYFRIFNPVTQSKKFDKGGAYIRQFVPELSGLPDKFIHEPWKMKESDQKKYNVHLGSEYPYPIVDHAEQRIKALEMYKI